MKPKVPKFTINNSFRNQLAFSEEQAKEAWNTLENAIDKIHKRQASNLSFEELYRLAYNLVLNKRGDQLYAGVTQAIITFLKTETTEVSRCGNDEILSVIHRKWTEHKTKMTTIKDILMYMDRNFVPRASKMPVYELGLKLFREHVIRTDDICSRLISTLLDTIARERTGELIDRSQLRSTISMLVEVGIHSKKFYAIEFEKEFLSETERFYSQEAQEFLTNNTCSDFLRKAEARLREENDRLNYYIDSSTEPALTKCVEKCFISDYGKQLVDMEGSGCINMLNENKIEDLSRMYALFTRDDDCLGYMLNTVASHIKKCGTDIVQDAGDRRQPLVLVEKILALKEKYNTFLVKSFKKDKIVEIAIKHAFEHFVNYNTLTAHYLSLYADELLRKGLKSVERDSDIESKLDEILLVFRFLKDKDIFENFYKQHLARRLLQDKSVSDDAEKMMISKLKTECGCHYTQKLEVMFKDIKLSSSFSQDFKGTRNNSSVVSLNGRSQNIEFDVKILTTGNWPTDTSSSCNLPAEVQGLAEEFRTFYLQKHSGRVLTWKTSMGNADIKAFLGSKRVKHELNMSTYQMCIIMLFNQHGSLSVKEVMDMTMIPLQDLKKHLLGFVAMKLMLKSSKGKEVALEDRISLNDDYASKMYRIKVPTVNLKESAGEAGNVPSSARMYRNLESEVPPTVEEDRKHLTEASIVRIMKARKSLEHNNLISEVVKQLSSRFTPNPLMIKKRIESLIEREYLERTRDDRRVYKYLA
eukprot:CAMPEP_0115041442 /NCGR_PEP_ID=MMETSP0216-20121206/45523_1 /TAXON_ID=223996 /ORGANISM="Protocruzia adherens, Strain Boccale" /LENGTH=755 /DNA_ID=CAMNT_0002423067 /DNA_START=45 /DNA_END=2312 /DNA_ORIENTATION=-